MAKRIDILEEKFLNTIKNNNLIDENEVIVVGVSGGPDSITLLECLRKYQEKLKIKSLNLSEEKYKNVIKLEKYKYMIWGLCEQLSEKGEIQNKEYLELLKKEKDFIIENKSLLGRKFELLFRLMMISPIFVKCFYRIL